MQLQRLYLTSASFDYAHPQYKIIFHVGYIFKIRYTGLKMFFYPRNITCHLHVLCAEFIANSRCLYTSSLASIHSCFSPVFQLYKTYFSWFRRPKIVEPILYCMIACVRRHLVAKFEYNI